MSQRRNVTGPGEPEQTTEQAARKLAARGGGWMLDRLRKKAQGGPPPIRVTTTKGESGKPDCPSPSSASPFGEFPTPEVGQ